MHPKQHIANLPALLKQKGAEQAVISPGSRNAPLIKLFVGVFGENCYSIVDERSAGFFALGLAIKSQKPVVLLSTSGSAVLNYGPAIAEAYHQGVPLIVVTADRPPEWIDQQDNQTINQKNIFANIIKYSCELPVTCTVQDEIWYADRLVNEAYNTSVAGKAGPVHINVPLREPLYTDLPEADSIQEICISTPLDITISEKLVSTFIKTEKILIVCGQMVPDEGLSKELNEMADLGNAVVIAEPISNISGRSIINCPDLILATFQPEKENLIPDLVIYFGGQVVSKRLKTFLREIKGKEFWYIDPFTSHVDTFKNLTEIIPATPVSVFHQLNKAGYKANSKGYFVGWGQQYSTTKEKVEKLVSAAGFSDLNVFYAISKLFTGQDIIFAGNSSVIRYLQMFDFNNKAVYSNRGTSGIDGCLSTAAGIAENSQETVYAIMGDLSFLYDSNGLWNKKLPKNLKIIVINNSGGGIFGLLEGPSSWDIYNDFLVAHHPADISKLCGAFFVPHLKSDNLQELDTVFSSLASAETTALLEIVTPAGRNDEIFRTFGKNLSKQN